MQHSDQQLHVHSFLIAYGEFLLKNASKLGRFASLALISSGAAGCCDGDESFDASFLSSSTQLET